MKLEGDYRFDASVQQVWNALFDPAVLAAVMPGCEKLDLVDGQYVGEINIKVGPIQGKFNGKVDLKDKHEPNSYTMVVDGRGAPGFVKATASVKLGADGTGTLIHYDADAQVGGKIASIGQRLLDASARAIVKQSLEGLHENIKLRAAAYGDAPAAEAPAASAPTAAAATEPTAAAPVVLTSVPRSEPTATAAAAATTPPSIIPPVSVASAAVAAPPKPLELKRADTSAMAASIAKEVARSLVPKPVYVALALIAAGLVVWLIARH